MADPYITPQAPASAFGPQQDRRTTLLQMARIDPMLTPQQKAALVTWLQGQAPLTDPALYAWVTRGGETAAIPGAGPVQVPGAPQAAPVPAASSSNPPGAPQSVAGTGQATGAQAAGGLYQNYIANQQKAASRPIAENPTKGINAGGVTGSEMTPPPPVTAATTPNATNPTAPNPTNSSSTGGDIMANPTVPGGGNLPYASGAALVGGNAIPDVQLREGLRAAGYDPYSGGLGQQFLARLMQPVLQAESSFYGFGNPSADYTKAGDFIKNIVNSFTTKGVNAGAMAQQFANNLLGNQNFMQNLNNVGDYKQQQGALQNLLALRNFGKSDLEQAAAAAQTDRLLGQYSDAALGLGGGQQFNGNFTQYLSQDPRGQALARLLGIGG